MFYSEMAQYGKAHRVHVHTNFIHFSRVTNLYMQYMIGSVEMPSFSIEIKKEPFTGKRVRTMLVKDSEPQSDSWNRPIILFRITPAWNKNL